MSLRLPNSSLGLSALSALSGVRSILPLQPVYFTNIQWNTNNTQRIYSSTDKGVNPYLVTPLSTYGLSSIDIQGDGIITTFLNGYIDHMVSLWLQVNNEVTNTSQYGNLATCKAANRLYDPDGGQHWKTNTTSFSAKKGDILTFYIGSGYASAPAGYFFNQLAINIGSTSFTKTVTLSSPLHFDYYGRQDYDILPNYINLSDYRNAMNYDQNITLNSQFSTKKTLSSSAYYYYTANNSIKLYPNPLYPVSGIKLLTRHVDGSGSYISFNSIITNTNTNNILYQINGETFNSLPICRPLTTGKTSLSTVFRDLSSYATFYLDDTNRNIIQKTVGLTIEKNISFLQFNF